MNSSVKYDFAGQVALVTGAGAGMGLAAAQAFAEAGAAVVLADRDLAAAQRAADQLTTAGHRALAVGCDVAVEAEVAALIAQAVATFGRLDIAFNNAGVMQHDAPTADLPTEEWDRVLNVNLRGVWLCMKYELAQMRQQGSGAIVNSSSIGGLTGVADLPAYTTAKHGLIGLTKTAALDYITQGIRVNAVCPGMIDTPMNDALIGGDEQKQAQMLKKVPMGRLGTPVEIAQAVLWLSSSAASYVTGQALAVDGGYVLP